MGLERRGRVTPLGLGQRETGGALCLSGRRQPSLGGTSRMNREVHVRFCEGPGVRFPGPTRPHICAKKRSNGRFTVLRQTIRKRLQTKLNEVKAELQRRMHEPIPDQGKWLQAVVRGHIRYYGVPMNNSALALFRFQVGRLWHRALSRRSQNGRILWARMRRLINRWLPLPSVCHPYHLRRMGVLT